MLKRFGMIIGETNHDLTTIYLTRGSTIDYRPQLSLEANDANIDVTYTAWFLSVLWKELCVRERRKPSFTSVFFDRKESCLACVLCM